MNSELVLFLNYRDDQHIPFLCLKRTKKNNIKALKRPWFKWDNGRFRHHSFLVMDPSSGIIPSRRWLCWSEHGLWEKLNVFVWLQLTTFFCNYYECTNVHRFWFCLAQRLFVAADHRDLSDPQTRAKVCCRRRPHLNTLPARKPHEACDWAVTGHCGTLALPAWLSDWTAESSRGKGGERGGTISDGNI